MGHNRPGPCAPPRASTTPESTNVATHPFLNLYRHGFVRVAVAVPRCRVADNGWNGREFARLLGEGEGQGAAVVAFHEMGLSA